MVNETIALCGRCKIRSKHRKHWWCKECSQAYTKEYRQRPSVKERVRKVWNDFYQRLKLEILRHYSKAEVPFCACCKETTLGFLTLDHINQDGAQHRRALGRSAYFMYRWIRKQGFPEGFQVLCFNCNCGRALNKGVCPHQEQS